MCKENLYFASKDARGKWTFNSKSSGIIGKSIKIYTEILARKVELCFFFTSETSEKNANRTLQVKTQNFFYIV